MSVNHIPISVPGAAALELDVDAVGVDGPVSGMRVSAAAHAQHSRH